MTVFMQLTLPETKGVPLERMWEVWSGHWLWRRYVPPLSTNPVAADKDGDGMADLKAAALGDVP